MLSSLLLWLLSFIDVDRGPAVVINVHALGAVSLVSMLLLLLLLLLFMLTIPVPMLT